MIDNNLIIYKNNEGNIIVDAIYKDETLWLTQKGMAKVFDVQVPAISKHLKNIFDEDELNKNSVVSKMEITADDGKNYNTEVYNLDAIIAVGYRVNSKKATEFRIWATKVIKEYMTKGFALNDERFIRGNKYDAKYFDELLERIKTIRVSERMCYQKITDLFIYKEKELCVNIPSIWTDWFNRTEPDMMIIGQDWGPYNDMKKFHNLLKEDKSNWKEIIELEKSNTKKMLEHYIISS